MLMTMITLMLMFSTITVMSASNWLIAWMGLELNLIFFTPLLNKPENFTSSEAMMTYFMVQSLGSVLMLISVLVKSSVMLSPLVTDDLMKNLLVLSMLIKLGAPPFHSWFPEIVSSMNWGTCLILMTWQKIAPLVILSQLIHNWTFTPLIIILSASIGSIGGINQTSTQKILAWSSISHIGWILTCMKHSNEMWVHYFILYSLIVTLALISFMTISMYYMNQMIMPLTFLEKMLLSASFMSLGGLPPFLGFLPKWIAIQSTILSYAYLTLMTLILSSLLTLFYYIRIITPILLMNSILPKWHNPTKITVLIQFLLNLNFMLPLMTMYSL